MGYVNWSIDKIHSQSKEIEGLNESNHKFEKELKVALDGKPNLEELIGRVISLESDLADSRRSFESLQKAWEKRLPKDVTEGEAILKYAEQAELCEEKFMAAKGEVFILLAQLKIIESSVDFPEKGFMRWAAEGAMMFCQYLKTKSSRLKENPDNEEVSQAGRYIEGLKE
ncbi:MAG: hypothetical protein ChlgKO_04920 [Chlamydiales bacterium]